MGFTAGAASGVVLALLLRGLVHQVTPPSIMNSTGNKVLFNTCTSFLALSGASYINTVVSRFNELKNGVLIYD